MIRTHTVPTSWGKFVHTLYPHQNKYALRIQSSTHPSTDFASLLTEHSAAKLPDANKSRELLDDEGDDDGSPLPLPASPSFDSESAVGEL